jgi:hypothetical protein
MRINIMVVSAHLSCRRLARAQEIRKERTVVKPPAGTRTGNKSAGARPRGLLHKRRTRQTKVGASGEREGRVLTGQRTRAMACGRAGRALERCTIHTCRARAIQRSGHASAMAQSGRADAARARRSEARERKTASTTTSGMPRSPRRPRAMAPYTGNGTSQVPVPRRRPYLSVPLPSRRDTCHPHFCPSWHRARYRSWNVISRGVTIDNKSHPIQLDVSELGEFRTRPGRQ